MSFKKYEAYKDSGVEWLGEIPSHWLCISLKNIEPYNSQMVQTGPFGAQLHASDYVDEGVPLILIKNVRNLAIDDSDIPKISAEDAKRLSIYRVEVGDIVFSRVGSIGRIAKVTEKERGWLISGQMLRLRLGSNSLNPAYSVYALSSKIVEDYVTYYSVGSTRDSINTEILMNLKIPLPSLEEQSQIAAFLDKETIKIDALIDKQEQLITLLREKRQAIISHAVTRGLNPNAKMKDSGIEWLGEVPEHWEVKKLKHIVTKPLMYGANEAAIDDDRDQPRFVRITDIRNNGTLREDTFRSLPWYLAKSYMLREGDVLLARSGATVGKSFIYSSDWGECCFAGYLIKASIDISKASPHWFYRYTESDYYWNWISSTLIQATIQNVSAEKYNNFFLCIPPKQEQERIIAYLDKETTKIDTLIEKCETAIELLKERRPALISAAVTGKIDVRSAV